MKNLLFQHLPPVLDDDAAGVAVSTAAVGGVPHLEAVTVGEGDECGEVHRVVGGILYAVRQVARLIAIGIAKIGISVRKHRIKHGGIQFLCHQ